MTAPSDNNGDDNERTQIGTPMPPRATPPEEGEASAPPVQQPPVAPPPAAGQSPFQTPPIQQPPYAPQPPADGGGDQASGWTMFGAPLPDPTQDPAPVPPTPEPSYTPPPPDPGYVPPAPDGQAAPPADHVPGPGEPGWVPGGGAAEAPATPSAPPGPGEPGWVPGGSPEEPVSEAPSAPAAPPGPGEPGWVPGGSAEPPETSEPSSSTPPGPGEPGWVPGGGTEEPVAETPSAAPGPGEPGWVPGGGVEDPAAEAPAAVPGPGDPGWTPGGGEAASEQHPAPAAAVSIPPASQPPVSHPPVSQPPVSQPPVSQPPVAPPPVSQPPVSQPPAAAEDERTMAAPIATPPMDQTAAAAPETVTAAAAAAPPPQPRRPRRSDGPTLEIGTVINNNYRIDEVLKAGGMGEVYRGAEVGTGDPVAIKVILPELAEDEKVGQMFKREARTLRQLQDEAIVRYYNYVHDPDLDAYCLVMSFISGVPLSDHTADAGPINVDEGKTLIRRLAKGLQKAHDLDVVHRDLSPDNVMLPHNKVEEAVIIDFGIAKSNVEKEQTLAGQFAGKFRYVSPEQLGHFGGDIGPQSDIYSLALLMAAALIGKPLEMGASIVEAVQSRQSIPDLSEVPPDLRPILMNMLEPDPANRPHTMDDVIRLMDFPDQIPLNYRQGLPLPNTALTHSGTTGVTGMPYRPPTNQVSGLQLAPTTATTGGTAAPGEIPKRRSGGGGLGIALVLALAVVGGGGYYGYTEGWFDAPVEPVETPEDEGEAPTRLANTREGFLASFNSGGCTYATRVGSGPNEGAIAGMASVPGAFSALPEAYAGQFGETPAVLDQQVTESQCAALALARSLQGTNLEPASLALATTNAATGMTVDGTLTDADNRSIWMVLITPNGQIFNLTSRLSDPVGVERSLQFNLNPIPAGSPPAPNLLLAIATEEPLVRAAAARDRTPASDLLPLIQREIDSRNGRAVAALAHVQLEPFVPPQPEPTESEEPGESEDTDQSGESSGTEGSGTDTGE